MKIHSVFPLGYLADCLADMPCEVILYELSKIEFLCIDRLPAKSDLMIL